MNKTNKEKTLVIADQQIPVNFSINYFFKFFKDKTGIDLLKGSFQINEMDTIEVLEWLSSLIYAGNNAYQKLHKSGTPLSAEEVQDTVFTMTPEDAIVLLVESISVIKGEEKESEEKNAPAQAEITL